MVNCERHQTAAWAFLIGATLFSFWAITHAGWGKLAVGVCMTTVVVKVLVVLRSFMASDRLPLPLRGYFICWSIGCGAMIFAFACFS